MVPTNWNVGKFLQIPIQRIDSIQEQQDMVYSLKRIEKKNIQNIMIKSTSLNNSKNS